MALSGLKENVILTIDGTKICAKRGIDTSSNGLAPLRERTIITIMNCVSPAMWWVWTQCRVAAGGHYVRWKVGWCHV